jgi:hypothetical protein
MNELIRNMHEGELGPEGEVYFGLFEKYINLFNWDGASDAYALTCAQYLNNLDDALIDHLCEASVRYCNDFLDDIGEEPKQFAKPRDVLSLIYPNSLSISNPEGRKNPVIHLELNCAWEEEHGMEWIIRRNKVLYVGAYIGGDPWGEFEPEEGNYAKP